MVLAFYFLVSGLSFFAAGPLIAKHGVKKMLTVGTFCSLYVLIIYALDFTSPHIYSLWAANKTPVDSAAEAFQARCL